MINFTKMHGLGNDYIYINCLGGKNEIKEIQSFTKYICHRNFGVGADGIILVKESKIADVKMEIFNADGSQAQMCGNGIRCFGKYVYEKEIIKKSEMTVETLGGIKKVTLIMENGDVKEVEVNMGCAIWEDKILPTIANREKELLYLQIQNEIIEGIAVSMGNPHFVIMSKNVDKIDINNYGPLIENHKLFPNKTNVEFIEVLGDNNIKMRVWERGTGETLACGTGACAAFAVCYEKGLVKENVKISLRGGELKVRFHKEKQEIYMTGSATKVFDGVIDWK